MRKLVIACMAMIGFLCPVQSQVLDDIVERSLTTEKGVINYKPLREADVMWGKRIWRVIDTREKLNQYFQYPPAPFFDILVDAALQGEVTLYSAQDDRFTTPLTSFKDVLYTTDTIAIYNANTQVPELVAINDTIFYEDVNRFRLKEVWYFNEASSTMEVRILGIAPILDYYDEHGDFKYEKPLFWLYYPELRTLLATQPVFNPGNDYSAFSWADIFDMRQFASSVYKQSNVNNARLQDYYSGLDRLLEAQKIEEELFNIEQDLWSR